MDVVDRVEMETNVHLTVAGVEKSLISVRSQFGIKRRVVWFDSRLAF